MNDKLKSVSSEAVQSSATPKTDALLHRHRDETDAMFVNGYVPTDSSMREHAQRQAMELIDHTVQIERNATRLVEALRNTLLAFAEVNPRRDDYKSVNSAALLLTELGETL